ALRQLQREALGSQAIWHSDLDKLPHAPSIIFANEFFDAIPIRQFEFHAGNWMERAIGLSPEGGLTIGLVQTRQSFEPRIEGAVIEISPHRQAIARAIGSRLAASPGAALIIDYGHTTSAPGDTLQALRSHRYCSI